MIEILHKKILNYYKNNVEISGFKGLVKKLATLEKFNEESVVKVCSEYKIYSIEELNKHVPNNINSNLFMRKF